MLFVLASGVPLAAPTFAAGFPGVTVKPTATPQAAPKWALANPSGVAVDRYGNVYVADAGRPGIVKLTSAGVTLTSWGRSGSRNGEFNVPGGVAADSYGNVFVADTKNNRVQKFNSSGVFLTAWGTLGSSNGQFNQPAAIAVDPQGDVYLADTSNHRIQEFTAGGVFVRSWGAQGGGYGQFRYPNGVAVDNSGNVYVCDGGNNRVQKFDSAGAFVDSWGAFGSGIGQFNQPVGVALDARGNIYVADMWNHRIQEFDSSGHLLISWGRKGSVAGQFQQPRGVAVDSTGRVFVLDNGNHRVQTFARLALPTTISDAKDNGTYKNGPATIHLSASDSILKVANVCYKVDGGSTRRTNGTRATAVVKDIDHHTIEFWATDAAGNPGPPKTATFRVTPMMGRPSVPSSVKRSRTFTISGSLGPHAPKGARSVQLVFYRYVGRAWTDSGIRAWATNGDSHGSTRYSANVKLPTSGWWIVYARHQDPRGGKPDSSGRPDVKFQVK